MDKLDDIKDSDLYVILEVESRATVSEIKKAYRKKALKCHPDKHPDNPKASELFLELSRALEILVDEKARAAYDKVYNAKKAAKIRTQELDSRRKKLKEELEARERQASTGPSQRFGSKSAEEKLAAEIERLRKEGSRQLKEEMDFIKQKILEERKLMTGESDPALYRLKVKWKSERGDETNGGYNTDNLIKMFSKYGDVDTVIVSQKKQGTALVEFVKAEAAIKAVGLERGLAENPLSLTWLTGEPPNAHRPSVFESPGLQPGGGGGGWRGQPPPPSAAGLFPSMNPTSRPPSHLPKAKVLETPDVDEEDFELRVLQRLRQAEENKRKASETGSNEPPSI